MTIRKISKAVERVPGLTRQRFVEEFLRPGNPVVVPGGAVSFDEMSQWTPQSLSKKLGEKKVRVARMEGGVFRYSDAERFHAEMLTFRELIEEIHCVSTTGGIYLMQQSIARDFPELLPQVTVPYLLTGEQTAAHLWVGSAHNVTPLHYDPLCNLFLQLHGRKRFLLYSPSHYDEMYPPDIFAEFSHVSPVNAEDPDIEHYPRFSQAVTHEVVLESSDLLFLPPYWWHCVRSLDISVSVNFWWAPDVVHCMVPAMERTIKLLYQRNRLATMGAPIRDREGFMHAAHEFQAKGLNECAVLLACAEVELAVRELCVALSIEQTLDETLRPLSHINRELFDAGAYEPNVAERIARIGLWAEIAISPREWQLGDSETKTVLNEVLQLTHGKEQDW